MKAIRTDITKINAYCIVNAAYLMKNMKGYLQIGII